MKSISTLIICQAFSFSSFAQLTYPIVDTKVSDFYNNSSIISEPAAGSPFFGQDATYNGNQASYTDNGNGTITDNVTGLMWEQDMGVKISYYAGLTKAANSALGGHTDWRVPTIKELYSLAQFNGRCFGDNAMFKFIDTNYFNQPIGNTSIGEREIDAQTWSITKYVGLTMGGDSTVFGFNFVDGRLKGYPMFQPPASTVPTTMYFRMVRGNATYGINNFVDNGDGTITDNATGLMWQKADDGNKRNWKNALSYTEDLTDAGYSDWRLPNAKELHSIVDYTRSPDVTGSPAIAPLFSCTSITDPTGWTGQYGYYWTSSPLMDGPTPYTDAVYICFGEAQGLMFSNTMDVHGAGAQRNDPKIEASGTTYPNSFGPQGDYQYVNNFVRAVRDINSTNSIDENGLEHSINLFPNPATMNLKVVTSQEVALNKIELFNMHGQLFYSVAEINQIEIIIDVSNLQAGIYLLKIQTSQGIDTKKIVVK